MLNDPRSLLSDLERIYRVSALLLSFRHSASSTLGSIGLSSRLLHGRNLAFRTTLPLRFLVR